LIQLMPATASDVARWNGLPRLTPEEFFIPEHSVLYGSLYINSQARRYQHPAVFLAAYNAGPGNASRWIEMHGFDPDDQELYIEQITYRETRLYAKKVQRSAWIYGRIRR
ncbi:MAG TPA: transglycosylase SLT domain-containing protein, partial [Candidatus Sabulitectum sp.]|nr:transglycosylase SLT domain-containing protein [Candidatus Sabulitectum sp.]